MEPFLNSDGNGFLSRFLQIEGISFLFDKKSESFKDLPTAHLFAFKAKDLIRL